MTLVTALASDKTYQDLFAKTYMLMTDKSLIGPDKNFTVQAIEQIKLLNKQIIERRQWIIDNLVNKQTTS